MSAIPQSLYISYSFYFIAVLDSWSQVLSDWDRDNPLLYPKQLPALVKQGIPEALRGEVWQRLTGASIQQVGKHRESESFTAHSVLDQIVNSEN